MTLATSKNVYEEIAEVVIGVLLFWIRIGKYESAEQKVQKLGD